MDYKSIADSCSFVFHRPTLSAGNNGQLDLGMDIGYGSLKTMSRFGLHKVSSLVIPFELPQNTEVEDVFMNVNDILYIENRGTPDEKIWAVGQKALDTIGAQELCIDLEEYYNKKWFYNKEFQILYNVGIFLSQLRSDYTLEPVNKYHLCVGLPIQWVKYEDELRMTLIGKREFDIMLRGEDDIIQHLSFEMNVEDIDVIPQHEGTLNSLLLDYDGNVVDSMDFAHSNILLLDAGMRTVDTHLLMKNNKSKGKTWTDVSMLTVKNDVCGYIMEVTDNEREIQEFELDRYIGGRNPCVIRCNGVKIDFSDVLQKSIEEKIMILSKRIEAVFNLDDIDTILVVGGSGLCYFDRLKEIFSSYDLRLVDATSGPVLYDATFSNVVGYYKLEIFNSLHPREDKKKNSAFRPVAVPAAKEPPSYARRDTVERPARDQAERETAKRVEREAAERAEREAAEQAEREAAEQAEREAAEQAEREAAEQAEREAAEQAEREAAEQAEREAAEQVEREAAEQAAREAAERAEQEAAEQAAREAAERAEQEAAEQAAREQVEREFAERSAKERAEREEAKQASIGDAERIALEMFEREEAQRRAQKAAAPAPQPPISAPAAPTAVPPGFVKSPMIQHLEKRAAALPVGSPQRKQVEEMIATLIQKAQG